MMEMLFLYKTTLVAGAMMAGALALIGMQLAARDRSMQTVCVGQGASVGVILGMGILHVLDLHATEDKTALFPFAIGLLFSALTTVLTDRLVRRRLASKNTIFAFVFAALIAAGHLMGSLFPGLETHLSQIYFGDLSTLGEGESKIASVVGFLAVAYLLLGHKPITLASFDSYLVGESRVLTGRKGYARHFSTLSLVIICLSVQYLGFLFTIACLFIPTAMLSYFPIRGLRRHLSLGLGVAMTAAIVGFLLSLQFTRLPTVPSVVACMVLLCGWLYSLERFAVRK